MAAAAFEGWHVRARAQRRAEEACSNIIARLRNLELAAALACWREQSRKQQHAARTVDRCADAELQQYAYCYSSFYRGCR